MSNKEIRIKWISDETEISKSIQRLQTKLQQMNKTSAQVQNITETGGTLSKRAQHAQKAFDKSSEALLQRESRELEQRQRKENIALLQKQRELNKLEKSEGRITVEKKKQLNLLKEEINLRAQKVMDIEVTKQDIDSRISSIGRAGKAGILPNQNEQKGRSGIVGLMSSIAKNLNPTKIAAAMAGSARMYGQYLGIEQTREREVQGYRGVQTQAQNIGFQDVMGGKGNMRFYEGQERSQALQMAMEERKARLSGDPMRAAASVGGSALAGAGAGAIGGSFLPGVGNVAGGIMGGVAGAGNAIFGNKGVFRQMFDREAYTADVNAQTMQNYRGNLANLRMQDPEKYAAANQFGKRAGNLQKLQRRIGLSDKELFGDAAMIDENYNLNRKKAGFGEKGQKTMIGPDGMGYQMEGDASHNKKIQDAQSQSSLNQEFNKNRQIGFLDQNRRDRDKNVAFSEERIMKNINNIFSAGGSSGFVQKGGAGIAAEYQRAGFTGAGKELGAISGLGENVAQTEDSYVKLLAEGVKLGFNASKPSEEMRKFTSIAAQMFRATGGAEAGVAMMGKAVTGLDMASLEAGQDIFKRRDKEAGEASGYRGALKQSFLTSERGQEQFGNISENMKQYFTESNLSNLDKDNIMVKEFADKQFDGDTDKAIAAIREMQEFGSNINPETDKAREDLRTKYEDYRKKNGEENDATTREEFIHSKEGQSASAKYQAAYALERQGVGQMTSQQVEGNVGFVLGGAGGAEAGDINLDVTKGQGKVLDEFEASKSADQMAQMATIANSIEKLASSFEKNSQSSLTELIKIVKTADMEAFIEKLEKSDKELAASIFSAFAQNGGFNTIPNQPTTGNGED